jgi:hypothetical protein
MNLRILIAWSAAFLCFFGGYLLLLKGPAATPEQAYFRMGIAAVGIILGIIAIALKGRGQNNCR